MSYERYIPRKEQCTGKPAGQERISSRDESCVNQTLMENAQIQGAKKRAYQHEMMNGKRIKYEEASPLAARSEKNTEERVTTRGGEGRKNAAGRFYPLLPISIIQSTEPAG